MKYYFPLFLIVTTLICGCSTEKKVANANVNEVAFIEYVENKNSVAIEGSAPQGPRMGQPTYSFNKDNRLIEIQQNIGAIDPNKIIAAIGIKKILKGTSGNGVASSIHGIDNTPYISKELTIDKISHDKILFTINNQQITLDINQTWQNQTTKRDTLNYNGRVIIETTATQAVIFHGFIPRTNFIINQQSL